MPQFFIDRPLGARNPDCARGRARAAAATERGLPRHRSAAAAITTSYPGANAATVETTVTQVIERRAHRDRQPPLLRLRRLLDHHADLRKRQQPRHRGRADATECRSPSRCGGGEPAGIRIAKVAAGFLGGIGLVSAPGGSAEELNNIVASVLEVFRGRRRRAVRSESAMRIWLDADKLKAYSLSASAALRRCSRRMRSSPLALSEPGLRARRRECRGDRGGSASRTARADSAPHRVERRWCALGRRAGLTRCRADRFETSIGATPIAAFGIRFSQGHHWRSPRRSPKNERHTGSFPAGVKWVWAWDSTPSCRSRSARSSSRSSRRSCWCSW